jgi:hypothetical protein
VPQARRPTIRGVGLGWRHRPVVTVLLASEWTREWNDRVLHPLNRVAQAGDPRALLLSEAMSVATCLLPLAELLKGPHHDASVHDADPPETGGFEDQGRLIAAQGDLAEGDDALVSGQFLKSSAQCPERNQG